jgi:1-phosphatidylinositol phosphodiesterase
MRSIADNTNITRMAIPGTHDSGAWQYCVTPMCRAHDVSIATQLDIGVRAFDIRVGDAGGGTYKVYHGPVDMGITVQSVLDDIVTFLDTNRSEFIILMLKQETGKIDISGPINGMVNTTLVGKLYNSAIEEWPDISALRRRVLVFSRLPSPHASHFNTTAWPDNPSEVFLKLTTKPANFGIVLQDLYNSPKVVDKQKAIVDLLDHADASQDKKLLYVNYTSFVWKPYQPLTIGRDPTKPWLLKQRGKGVICVDAVDTEITDSIIGNNVRMSAPATIPVPRARPGQTLAEAFAEFRLRVHGEG